MRAITLDHADQYKAATFSASVSRPDLTGLVEWIRGPSAAANEADVRAAHPAPWAAGEVLWVREHTALRGGNVLYGGDYIFALGLLSWRSPSKMPRKLARIFLRVTAVRLTCAPADLCLDVDALLMQRAHGDAGSQGAGAPIQSHGG